LFLWIYILRITALNFISSFSHISIACSFNFHSFALYYSYLNPNIFHLLFKLRPSSLDIVSFLSHVLYTLLRHLLICLKLLVLNVKIFFDTSYNLVKFHVARQSRSFSTLPPHSFTCLVLLVSESK